MAEVACLAVHPAYRRSGHGDMLLKRIESEAKTSGLAKLFVLTTRTAHWFLERGFSEASLADLPLVRKDLYNFQRNSKVFLKAL
jgi:amino-acid N-acetyltransferase